MSDTTRVKLEARIAQKEYSWYRARTGYLVQLALHQRTLERREKLLEQARKARQAFYEFDASHPDIEVVGHRTVDTVEELIARIESLRTK